MYHMPERGKEKEGKRHRTYQPHLQIDDRDDRTPHAKLMACKWLAVFVVEFLTQGQEIFCFSQTPGEHWKLRLFIRVPAFLFFFINLNGSFANLN
jgi:hypothetical protein